MMRLGANVAFVVAALVGAVLAKDAGHIEEVKHDQEVGHQVKHAVAKVVKHHEVKTDEHAEASKTAASRTNESHDVVQQKASAVHSDEKKVDDKKVDHSVEAFTFQALDLNHDGVITEAEYNHALGVAAPEHSGKQMMRRAKTSVALDHNGEASAAALVEEELVGDQDPDTTTVAAAATTTAAAAAGNSTNSTVEKSAAGPKLTAASSLSPVLVLAAAAAAVLGQ